MNVLPVLVDLSPSIRGDLSAPNGGPSVDGFAQILDSALTGTNAASGRPSSPSSSAPYEPPTKPLANREPSGVRPTNDNNGRPQKAPANAASSDRPEKQDSASGRPSGSGEHSDHRVKEKGGQADSSPKESQAKSKSSEKGTSNAPARRAAQEKKTVHEKKAGKQPGDRKTDAGVKEKATPFPGAIILGGTKKEVQAALDRAVRRAAKLATPGAKAQHITQPRVDAKGTPVAGASAEKPGAEEVRGKKAHTTGKKSKATTDAGAKIAQVAAQLQPGPELIAVTGGNLQPAAAANAAPHAPGGQPAHAAVPTPGHNPAGAAPALTVIDLRHSGQGGSTTTDSRGGQNQSGESAALRLFQLADGGTSGTSSPGGPVAARAAGAPFAGQGFSALTDHIVKQTGILLKDNNSGEIRLVLKPENLGQLRIKIDMVNNNLTGKIFVQNHDALRLVQQNLDGLYRALRDSGFNASQLNVSVGGRENHEREKARSSPLPLLRAVEGVKGFDSQVPAMEAVGGAHSLVNLVI